MYNKIFTKILDSSIWLEPIPTRVVWLTLIAAMDEEGFAQFASTANLAHRARVSQKAAEEAVASLEGPDSNSSDPENDGRRVERVPGGWMILNARKYRDLVTREICRQQTRARVAKHREKKLGNDNVTTGNETVTPSEAETDTKAETDPSPSPSPTPTKVRVHSETELRLGRLFRRKETTRWSAKELQTLRKLEPIPDDELKAIETYYGAKLPETTDYRRRDLITLLNNWSGELDRARKVKINTGY